MNEQNREQLSAFMDDELSPAQSRRLLDAMRQDSELRQFWQSGHMISAAMHGDILAQGSQAKGDPATEDMATENMAKEDKAKEDKAKEDKELAQRVREALALEPALLAPTPAAKRRSLGPLGGLALAASVAMLAVIATQQALLNQQLIEPRTVAGESATAPTNSAQLARFNNPSTQPPPSSELQRQRNEAQNVALTRMTWNDAGPGVEARLNAYLLNHSEYMVGGLHGMLPYARVVGYGQTK